LVAIRSCVSSDEAQVVRSFLEAEGIQVYLQGENHRALLGMMGPYIELRIMVPPEQAEEAVALLASASEGIGGLSESEDALGGLSETADPAGALSVPGVRAATDGDEPASFASSTSTLRPKLPVMAVFLSLCVTFGTGHLYAGATKRGIGLGMLEIAALAWCWHFPGSSGLGLLAILAIVATDAVGATQQLARLTRRSELPRR
jgi:hypothetical protein